VEISLTEQVRIIQILHIMASSLKQAQPVLAAAAWAGFRESGVQSLRCLANPDTCPIVAVRSSGLALESVIGYRQRGNSGDRDGQDVVCSLVSEDYLRMLVAAANERFKTNSERMDRFKAKLLELCLRCPPDRSARGAGWEDPSARKARKREEGLQKWKHALEAREGTREPDDESVLGSDDYTFLGLLNK
jgi:tRNA wybutosine-synthesizing protein 3